MQLFNRLSTLFLALASPALLGAETPPGASFLQLHPENPHYFLFRGKPAILVTSGEHYGAVLNLDFDYTRYLDELASKGLNLTRTFTGVYREVESSFGITGNTLAPLPGRFICPFARSTTPGDFDGGNKFDLTRWDEAYFARLKDFLAQASRRGIVVELTLFCPMYEDVLWKASPMNAANNVNGIGDCPRTEVYALKHPDLLAVQEAVTRKIVRELRSFDNLYYEVCNEPYFGGVTREWQDRIISVIGETEADFPEKHLISLNIANGSAKVVDPNPAVSIFNFHYCAPPDAVALNYGLDKVIGENETGFRGRADATYRTEGWDFIIAGGALYNNLDYSFTPRHPDGAFLDYKSPGGGSPALRSQLKVLKDFLESFDFIRMAPDGSVIRGGVPPGLSARALSEPGRAYAVYIHRSPARRVFAVRWTGKLEAPRPGNYTLHTLSDDGVRLWIDGRLVIDDWTDHSAKEDTAQVALEGGKLHDLKMEYYQSGGGAVARLYWSSPGRRKEIIPAERFRLPGGGQGLRAEYFEDKALSKLILERIDAAIDFDWSARSPFAIEEKEPSVDLGLELPRGRYLAEWLDPASGRIVKSAGFEHAGGAAALASPPFADDIALRLKASED
jgi:hypothetical protein